MVVYDSASLFIETATKLCDKLVKVEAIIDALYVVAADSATNDGINEYWLDDGQSKIKTVYNSTKDVMKSIEAFEMLANKYRNKLNGRVARLVDSKSFRHRRNGFF